MADQTPSRLGQADATGDDRALFLKVFAGEVLSAFHRDSAFRDKHLTRTITSGKSAQFPVTGLAGFRYHTPGQEIFGDTIRHGEKVITIDDMIISPAFIANIDEALNHYDVRAIYAGEIGEALAKGYDQNVARAFLQAARGVSVITGGNDGGNSENASYDSDGTVIWKGIYNAGVALDTKDVPSGERYAWLRPVQHALVVQSEKPIDVNLNANRDNGGIDVGDIRKINQIMLVKTNNLPSVDDSANTAIPSHLRDDYSVTRGLIGHRSAAGTVQVQGVALESAYDIRRQGTLMVGKYLCGHGDLRPEAAYELRTGAPS